MAKKMIKKSQKCENAKEEKENCVWCAKKADFDTTNKEILPASTIGQKSATFVAQTIRFFHQSFFGKKERHRERRERKEIKVKPV